MRYASLVRLCGLPRTVRAQAQKPAAAIAAAASSAFIASGRSLTEGEAVRFVLAGTSALKAAARSGAGPPLARSGQPPTLRAALEAAVERSVSGPGRVAVLLSGGLDSALIAVLANRIAGRDRIILCQAQSLFATEVERRLAADLASTIGTGILVAPNPEPWWQSLLLANRAAPYPVGGAFVGVFAAVGRELASEGIGSVLSGDGADDLFAIDQLQIADLIRRRRLLSAWRLAASIAMWIGESPQSTFVRNGLLPVRMQSSKRARKRVVRRMTANGLQSAPCQPSNSLRGAALEIAEEITASWLDENRSLPSFAAESRWRASIDASEGTYHLPGVRRLTPYLDPEVVGCALSVLGAGGDYIGARDKETLRRTFADLLPPAVRWHRKTGRPDVVARVVTIDKAALETAFERVRQATGGIIQIDKRFTRRDDVPPDKQQGWLRSLYLAAWLEANE